MLLRLCQLKSRSFLIVFLTLSGCTWRQDTGRVDSELLTTFSNKWFAVNHSHSLFDRNLKPVPHLYFDTLPEFINKDRTVSVVIATPEGSAHAYDIDLNSGQRHYSHTYCNQSDVWSKYSGTINRPVFSVGHIPRVLDQLGGPQKIIVWSKRKKFTETAMTNYHKVKLVGAYVEQVCPEGNCLGKSNWLSRLVFIGVDGEDPLLSAVTSVKDFKDTFDWDTSKAVLENIDGRNFMGDQTYPTTRVGELIEYEEAFDFFKKRSIFLTDKELVKIQRGCHLLYDRLWKEVGKSRPEDFSGKDIKELAALDKLKKSLKAKGVPVGFAERFKTFTNKYFNEVSTCEKFVYHGNVNRNREAFWFLSYVGIYYKLHREGYYFDCKHRSWKRNSLNNDGEPIYNLPKDIYNCPMAEIDHAMDYIPNFLDGLKSEKEYFRFIDYDNHSFGTHNKMYSWVKVKARKFDCSDDPNLKIRKELQLFPEDVRWQKRESKDLAKDLKIIF